MRLGRPVAGGAARFRAEPASAPDVSAPLSRFSSENGEATDAARVNIGSFLYLAGYLSPTSRAGRYLLTERSIAPCRMCGSLHVSGSSIIIETDDPRFADADMTDFIVASGALSVVDAAPTFFEPQARLIGARLALPSP